MTEAFHEPILPRVTDADLSLILFEDIADPNHIGRWADFALANPELSREVLRRAYEKMKGDMADVERVKIVIDLLSYAVRALETATKRILSDEMSDDVGQPPSV